jgi:hypothetical protein
MTGQHLWTTHPIYDVVIHTSGSFSLDRFTRREDAYLAMITAANNNHAAWLIVNEKVRGRNKVKLVIE